MGTRSDIIVQRADNTWKRVYCHWDGYPDHNGKILFEHYNSQELATALVEPGDMSSLAETIGEKHDFNWGNSVPYDKHIEDPRYKMTLYYGRDRGETDVDGHVFFSLSEAWPGEDRPGSQGTEFTYVFCSDEKGGMRWFVGDPDEGQQTMRDLGAVLSGEEEEPKTAIKAFGGNFIIGHR